MKPILRYIKFLPLWTCINCVNAQGLINNGAHIELTPGAFIYIDGGAATGNFTNQDAGINIGTVESQGTIDVTGDWINNSTLNCFNANTGTVRLLGVNQNIGGTTTTWFNNLTLLGTGTKTLNINTLVGGGFALPGGILTLNDRSLDLNTHRLTINNPATTAINFTTGYIISETPAAINPSIVQWNMNTTTGSYIYPFGVAATQIPFTLNKISAGASNISVSTRATALPNNTLWEASVTNMYSSVIGGAGEVPVVIDRWYDINPSAPAMADLTFTYRGIENTTTFAPTGSFAAQNWNGTTWLPPVGSGPGVLIGTASVTAVTQNLSATSTPWVLSNITAPLPIELLSFEVICNNNVAEINWATASENNTDYFEVQRSENGIDFITVKKINATGNSTSIRKYNVTDFQPLKAKSYYRLKETDHDGAIVTFDAIAFSGCDKTGNAYAEIWSADHEIYIEINFFEDNHTTINLTDMSGKIIRQWEKDLLSGTNYFELPVNELSDGIYLVAIQNEKNVLTKKVMISK